MGFKNDITIRIRRDTTANWVAANPVLADGEAGIEKDTRNWKIGDGVTAWNDLEYWTVAPVIKTISSTTYTLVASDEGKILNFTKEQLLMGRPEGQGFLLFQK